MRDYFCLGATPADEPCAQVGTPHYQTRVIKECRCFITLLRHTFGSEPDGAELRVKDFPHDFGTYYEVVCYFDTDLKASMDYALRCEGETPASWEG